MDPADLGYDYESMTVKEIYRRTYNKTIRVEITRDLSYPRYHYDVNLNGVLLAKEVDMNWIGVIHQHLLENNLD